jgi:hypothetical protein
VSAEGANSKEKMQQKSIKKGDIITNNGQKVLGTRSLQ